MQHKIAAKENGTVIPGRLRAQQITRTGQLLDTTKKKKSTDYQHKWITHTSKEKKICTRRLQNAQIQRQIILVCSTAMQAVMHAVFFLGSFVFNSAVKTTLGPTYLFLVNVSCTTECKLTATFCCCDLLFKLENSFQVKQVLTGNVLLLRRVSVEYFYHQQILIYTCANKNLFLTNLGQLTFLGCFVSFMQ